MRPGERLGAVTLALLLTTSLFAGVGAAVTGSDTGQASSQLAAESTQLIYSGEALTLQAGPGQVVRGKTDLPAGTDLSIRIRNAGGSLNFFKVSSATVAKDGTFSATFDLSDVPAGTPVNVTVVANGSTLVSARGEVRTCTDACATPTPSNPSATIDGSENGITLAAGPGRYVAGSTNLPPGAELTIRILERGDTAAGKLASRIVTVGGNQTFRAVFNFSGVAPTTPVKVLVVHNGSRIASGNATIVACEVECQPPQTSSDEDDRSTQERNESEYEDLHTQKTTQGETARIELTFEPDTVTLTIGGPDATYALNASVRDGNGDDRVVILFATDKIGQPAVVSTANESDSVSIIDERTDGDRSVLDEGWYPIIQSVGPLTKQPDDNPESFLVERGRLVVSDTAADAPEDAPTVETFGWPQRFEDGERVGWKPVYVRMNQSTRIPINTDELKTTTLVIYSQEFQLWAVINDGTGDERVDVEFNAVTAGSDDEPMVSAAAEGDSVSILRVNGTLSPGKYHTLLYLGRVDPAVDGGPDTNMIFGTGQLIVSEMNQTPTLQDQPASPSTPLDRTLPLLGLLGVGGLFGALGIAFLVGLVEI